MSALLPLCQETLQVRVPVEQDAAATAAEPGQNSARSRVMGFGGSHLCLDHLLELQGSVSAWPAGGVCPAHIRSSLTTNRCRRLWTASGKQPVTTYTLTQH